MKTYSKRQAFVEVQAREGADRPGTPPSNPSLSPYFLSTSEQRLAFGVELYSILVCVTSERRGSIYRLEMLWESGDPLACTGNIPP